MKTRIVGVLAIVASIGTGVALVPSCSSGGSSGPRPAADAEGERIQAFLDDRYKPSDVQHTYRTREGDTIDCIDFFLQPTAKKLAKRGTPITSIPTPPHPPRGRVVSEVDEHGSARACPGTTVGLLRVTREEILAAGDVYAAGTNPTIGPVTEPLNYTYSTSAAAGSSSWLQWFYLGDGNDTYTWHAYSTPQPSTIPTLWVPPSPTLGSNAITIAPVYVYDTSLEAVKFHLFVLVANAPSGNNRAVQTYSSLTNAWTDVTNSTGGQVYVWGITTDSSNGAFWGWTHFSSTGGGQIWTSDGASSITLQAGWPGFSSAAAVDSLEVLATNLTDIGLDSYLVAHGFMPGNNWQDSGVPGYQVTADSIYGSIYVLESGGRVWIYEGGDEVEITNAKCGGGTLSFVQIAAKNGIIYGLDSSRTVHYYTYATNCWAQVGTKTGFAYSIATDNGDFAGVWASDGSGNIWTAE